VAQRHATGMLWRPIFNRIPFQASFDVVIAVQRDRASAEPATAAQAIADAISQRR